MSQLLQNRKIIIAITGASGAIYAKSVLDSLVEMGFKSAQVGIVLSGNAQSVWQYEIGKDTYQNYPFSYYENTDYFAPFASGSAQFDTMVIVPCSMGTLAKISNGLASDLIARAADVILKEKRRLICVLRETPYNLIHLRNMEKVLLAGGVICPATPHFYTQPKTISELVDTVVSRILDLANLPKKNTYRWGHTTEK